MLSWVPEMGFVSIFIKNFNNLLVMEKDFELQNDFRVCSKCYCMNNTSLCQNCRECGSELN